MVLFLRRDVKAKSEEAALGGPRGGLGSLLCHRLAALALVSSHRARAAKHSIVWGGKDL